MTTMCALLHWTQANSFELVVRQKHGRPKQGQNRGGSRGVIGRSPPKNYELTLFTMIVYISENSIRITRPFCHLLFCHSSVLNYNLLHLSYSSEPVMRLTMKYYWNRPPTIIHRWVKADICPSLGNWEPKFSRKLDVSSSTPINWFISCNDSLFAGTTLTLHKSQVHCSGVMQWWACSSLVPAFLPAEAGCQTCDRGVSLLVSTV